MTVTTLKDDREMGKKKMSYKRRFSAGSGIRSTDRVTKSASQCMGGTSNMTQMAQVYSRG